MKQETKNTLSNAKDEETASAGSSPSPCSQGSDVPTHFNIYLFNRDTFEVVDTVTIHEKFRDRMDMINHGITKLIRENGGVASNQDIRITFQNPQELHLPSRWIRK